jgi:inhibitor of KinA
LQTPCHIFPLGDSAITIELGNHIDEALNQQALAIRQWLLTHAFDGLKDCLVGYSSVTVYYDPVVIKKKYQPGTTMYEWVAGQLRQANEEAAQVSFDNKDVIRIPVCYEAPFAPDLPTLAASKGLSTDEVIQIHSGNIYKVYMIGFLPGFSYMGQVPETIAVARKARPVPVQAGSVGIAGSQTGVYPLNSPGGWQIIGRTPLPLFNARAEQPVLLNAGDRVQFYAITSNEFKELSHF